MKTRSASGKTQAIKYEEGVVSETCPSDEHRPLKKTRRSYASSDRNPKRRSKKASEGKIHGKDIGKLSKLLDMPVEIFTEICFHLKPLDLLQLARSTRSLNQVLMSRKSRLLWRAARNSVTDLPDCPSDLSEPEYARFIFEHCCQMCFAPRATKVDCISRSRLCNGCYAKHILRGSTLIGKIPDLSLELLACIPCDRHLKPLVSLAFDYQCVPILLSGKYYSIRVHALVAKYRSAVPQGLSAEQAKIRREVFIKQEKKLIPAIAGHARDVSRWFHLQEEMKLRADAEIIERRVADIHKNLIALGYDVNDFPACPRPKTRWYKIMHQPHDLTPCIWNRVRHQLEACILFEKKQREKAELQSRRRKRRSELDAYISQRIRDRWTKDFKLYMNQSDVYALPTVQAIMAENESSGPITEERWNVVKDQVEKDMDEFSENFRTELIAKIIACKAATSSSDNVASDAVALRSPSKIDLHFLLSPSTFFQCTTCGQRQCHYPELLSHRHGWCSSARIEDFHFDVDTTDLAQTIIARLPNPYDLSLLLLLAGKVLLCSSCDGATRDWRELIDHFRDSCPLYKNKAPKTPTAITVIAEEACPPTKLLQPLKAGKKKLSGSSGL